jgi:hypothetical protein
MEVKRNGLDWAKHMFEHPGVSDDEQVVPRKTVRRDKLLATFKNDRNDAAAICEAVGRGTMRLVPIREVAQQAGRRWSQAAPVLPSTAMVRILLQFIQEELDHVPRTAA